MSEKTPVTSIADFGEFKLIKQLTRDFTSKQNTTLTAGGDDAAVIKTGKSKVMLVSVDYMLEGIHFDLIYHPLKHLGYKTVVMAISDIYAMNARPQQVTVSVAVSSRFSVEALEELYKGIWHACDRYDVDLVGGDTSASPKGLVISVTALGQAAEKDIVYRHTASPGDLIVVSGDLGAAFTGLQLLEREKQIFLENPEIQPDLEGEEYIVGRQLKPEARKDIIDILEDLKVKPTAMIDVSDGLSSDILQICTASGTGCRLREADIPIAQETYDRCLKFHIDATTAALNGGEDYELLFTIRPEDKARFHNNPYFSLIGEITREKDGYVLLSKAGKIHSLKAQGWNHLNPEA